MDKNRFNCCMSLNSTKTSKFSTTRRILWWIFALCCTGMFIWESYQTIEDFVTRPYVTSLTAMENESVELPTVRICPSNWINNTALKEQNVSTQQLEMLMEGFVDPYLMDNNGMEKNVSNLEFEFNRFIQDRPDFDIRRFFREQISLKCVEMFQYCRWQSEFLNCCDGEGDPLNNRKPLTNAGQCYLVYKRRYGPYDKNFQQTVPGPGGGLLIHIALPVDEDEVPGLAVR